MSEATPMQHFHTQKERFKEFRKVFLLRAVLLLLVGIPVGLVLANQGTMGREINLTAVLLTLPIAFGAGALGIFIGVKRQKRIFETFRLTLDTDAITREAYNTPTIRLPKSEIREIIKQRNSSFIIRGKSRLEQIGIPAQVAEYEKLEALLQEIMPINVKSQLPFFHTALGQILMTGITFGLIAALYLSENSLIVTVSGTSLFGLLAFSLYVIQNDKNTDQRTKNSSWFVLLPMLFIIGILYTKLG